MEFFSRLLPAASGQDASLLEIRKMNKQQATKALLSMALNEPSKPARTATISQEKQATSSAEVTDVKTKGLEKEANKSIKQAEILISKEEGFSTVNSKPKLTPDKEQGSTETNMTHLYNMLQEEAKKVQKFKVQAMAQIKQKSEEVLMRQQQIRALSMELSQSKITNTELMNRIKRQERHNEDVISRVVTTREMCFSLYDQFDQVKRLTDLFTEAQKELKAKSLQSSTTISAAMEKIKSLHSRAEQGTANLETAVKEREEEYNQLMRTLKAKANKLIEERDEQTEELDMLEEKLKAAERELMEARNLITAKEEINTRLEENHRKEIATLEETHSQEVKQLCSKLDSQRRTSDQERESFHIDLQQLEQALSSMHISYLELAEKLETEKGISDDLYLQNKQSKKELENTVHDMESILAQKEKIDKIRQDREASLIEKVEEYGQLADELTQEKEKVQQLRAELDCTKQSLEMSIRDKNVVAVALAEKSEAFNEVSNKLLVKDTEFTKLMEAVQSLKSRCAAVATQVTSSAPTLEVCSVRPVSAKPRPTTPVRQVTLPAGAQQDIGQPSPKQIRKSPGTSRRMTAGPCTPNQKPMSLGITPKKATPKAAKLVYTPSSSGYSSILDQPKGILKNEGSASKANRVVFSTPIAHKKSMPSDSDTSVFDLEMVNSSFQLKSTPRTTSSLSAKVAPRQPMGDVTNTQNSVCHTPQAKAKELSPQKPMMTSTPSHVTGKPVVVSPAASVFSQSSNHSEGERLPRSRMIKSAKKRPRSDRPESESVSAIMKKHRAITNKASTADARGEESDCFGFD